MVGMVDSRLSMGAPVKILQIVSAAGVNGVAKHVVDVGLGLRDIGHEVTYLCIPNSWLEQTTKSLGFPTIASDMHRWPHDELRRVSQEIRERDIDVVHTHMSKAHFFGVLLRWYAGVPSVATAHSCHLQLHWMFNDCVIAVSEATRRFHQRVNWVASRRVKTIHNFIKVPPVVADPAAVRSAVRLEFGLKDDDYVIGLVGRIAPQKGQTVMVQAMPAILAKNANAKLLLIGALETPEYVAEIHQFIATHHLEHAVQFLGMRNDVLQILRGMDVLAQPSLWEAFPISMLEGMAVGVPIVATDVGGVPECLEDHRSGLLIPANDPKALSDSIIELATDPALCERLVQEAKQVVEFRFSPASQIARIENALKSVLKTERRKAAA